MPLPCDAGGILGAEPNSCAPRAPESDPGKLRNANPASSKSHPLRPALASLAKLWCHARPTSANMWMKSASFGQTQPNFYPQSDQGWSKRSFLGRAGPKSDPSRPDFVEVGPNLGSRLLDRHGAT